MSRLYLVCLVCLAFVGGCLVSQSRMPEQSTASADAQQEEKSTVPQRWAVVETRIEPGGGPWRLHVVAPDGRWYIIPDAYTDWAHEIVEGQDVVLPASVYGWLQPVILRTNRDQLANNHLLLTGQTVRTALDSGAESVTEGIYFFAAQPE